MRVDSLILENNVLILSDILINFEGCQNIFQLFIDRGLIEGLSRAFIEGDLKKVVEGRNKSLNYSMDEVNPVMKSTINSYCQAILILFGYLPNVQHIDLLIKQAPIRRICELASVCSKDSKQLNKNAFGALVNIILIGNDSHAENVFKLAEQLNSKENPVNLPIMIMDFCLYSILNSDLSPDGEAK